MCSSTELFSWTVLFIIETVVIIAGNIITIIAFWKLRSVLKRTYYLLINLAIADLTVGFSAIEMIVSNIWELERSKKFSWKRFMAIDVLAGTTSLTILLFIALERFYAITYPFSHRALTKQIYMHGVVWAWVTGILVAAISLFPEFLSNPVITLASSWILTSLAVTGVSAVCCLYALIWKSSKKDDPRIPRDKREQNKRLAKTLFIVTLSSFVTWLPFAVTFVLPHHVENHESCILRSAVFAGKFLQLANSFLNPVVYCFRMPQFRRILRKLLRCSKTNANSHSLRQIGMARRS